MLMVDRVSRHLATFSDEREISGSIPVLGWSARRPRERHVAATRLTVLAGHTAFAIMKVAFVSSDL